MKEKARKSIAVLMSILTVFSVCTIFSSASEATPSDPPLADPFCEIEFRDGNAGDVRIGETFELYLVYDKEDDRMHSFEWYVEGGGTDGDYESTGFAEGYRGIKITPQKHGTITVRMLVGNKEGRIIAKDEIKITVIDERSFFVRAAESIAELIKLNIAYMSGLGIAITFLGAGVLSAIIELPEYLFNLIFG